MDTGKYAYGHCLLLCRPSRGCRYPYQLSEITMKLIRDLAEHQQNACWERCERRLVGGDAVPIEADGLFLQMQCLPLNLAIMTAARVQEANLIRIASQSRRSGTPH